MLKWKWYQQTANWAGTGVGDQPQEEVQGWGGGLVDIKDLNILRRLAISDQGWMRSEEGLTELALDTLGIATLHDFVHKLSQVL